MINGWLSSAGTAASTQNSLNSEVAAGKAQDTTSPPSTSNLSRMRTAFDSLRSGVAVHHDTADNMLPSALLDEEESQVGCYYAAACGYVGFNFCCMQAFTNPASNTVWGNSGGGKS